MAPVDILIVTIIPEEYEAVCRRLTEQKADVRPPELKEGVVNEYGWRIASLKPKQGGTSYRIVVAMVGRPGVEEMSSAVKATMDVFEPRYVVLVGIAGGFRLDGLTKGDVAISDVIYFYEYGKQAKRFIPRNDFVYRVDGALLRAAIAWNVLDGEWKYLDEDKRPAEHKLIPKALYGVVASGNKLVDNITNDLFAPILKSWPKLLAVEMEGAGAAAAIQHAQTKGKVVGFIMIRGISDMPNAELEKGGVADPQARAQSAQRDEWKKYAAATAANFTVLWIAGGWPLAPRGAPPGPGGRTVDAAITTGSPGGGLASAAGTSTAFQKSDQANSTGMPPEDAEAIRQHQIVFNRNAFKIPCIKEVWLPELQEAVNHVSLALNTGVMVSSTPQFQKADLPKTTSYRQEENRQRMEGISRLLNDLRAEIRKLDYLLINKLPDAKYPVLELMVWKLVTADDRVAVQEVVRFMDRIDGIRNEILSLLNPMLEAAGEKSFPAIELSSRIIQQEDRYRDIANLLGSQ